MSIMLWIFLVFLAYLGYSMDFRTFQLTLCSLFDRINKIDRVIDCLRKELGYFSIENLYLK